MQTWPTVRRVLRGVTSAAGVQPQLVPGLGRSLLEGVLAGSLDMAIVLGPVFDGQFSHVTLGPEALLVALPEGHVSAARNTVPIQALAGERLVLFPRRVNPDLFDWYMSALADAGIHPQIVEEPVSEGSRRGVAGGLGFTLVPSSLARAAPLPGVVHRSLTGARVSVAIVLAWLADSSKPTLRQVVAVFSPT